MRSMVEGHCGSRGPSTALRAVPLPCKSRGGCQASRAAAKPSVYSRSTNLPVG